MCTANTASNSEKNNPSHTALAVNDALTLDRMLLLSEIWQPIMPSLPSKNSYEFDV